MRRALRIAAVVGLAGAAAGCGRTDPPAPASVRGRVTVEGRPLAGGRVVFAPDREKGTAGRPLTAAVADDGGYRLADGRSAVPPGWYRVALADPPTAFSADGVGPTFPAALRRPDRSGLSREVTPGRDHVLNFDVGVGE